MSELLLNIDGVKYSGWLNVTVRRSLETLADSFELSVTERWKNQTTRRPIAAGSACNISIDGERVITGFVDDVVPNYDAEQHSVDVAGRSKASDLIDCSFFSAEDFKGKRFDVIVKKVCAPFGIDVIVNADVGEAFTQSQKIEPGETVFEFLDRLARYRALRMVSSAEGALLITRTGTERVKTALRLGENILAASGSFSYRERFGEYSVMGQSTGDDNLFGAVAAEPFGVYRDSAITRYRPTVRIADGNINTDECKRQAKWERNTRMGRSGSIVYTVSGWRHADGLWTPNTLVPVDDIFMDVLADRLITEVQYILDDQGERTEIQVMRPEAFDLAAVPEDNDDESSWLDAGDA
jgi:prophage tail gpP-like protein